MKIIELDNVEALSLDLILTRRRAAEAEAKLAERRYKDAQIELLKTTREESNTVTRLAVANGIDQFKSVRVIGRNRIAFETENQVPIALNKHVESKE